MTILAQNGKIWIPNRAPSRASPLVSKKHPFRRFLYFILAIIFSVPAGLVFFGVIIYNGPRKTETVNHQLIQSNLDTNWIFIIAVYLCSFLAGTFFMFGFNGPRKLRSEEKTVLLFVPIAVLTMGANFANFNHSVNNDNDTVSSWFKEETGSKVDNLPLSGSKVITTDQGISYLISITEKDDQKIFTTKEIKTKE